MMNIWMNYALVMTAKTGDLNANQENSPKMLITISNAYNNNITKYI